MRIGRNVHFRRHIQAAFASPASHQRIEQGDGAAALRIVAIPTGVAAGMNEGRGPVARHLAGGGANRVGIDARLRIGPFRREGLDLRGKLLEAEAVLVDILLVVEFLADDHVHPGEQQGDIGSGLDRQIELGLAGRNREARVGDNQADAAADRMGELLHLGVVHVLAQVRADQHEALRVLNVRPLRRSDIVAVGEREADIARSAALRKRRRSNVVGAVGSERVLEERAAKSVDESRKRFGTIGGLDLLHLLGDEAQRLVPSHFLPLLLAALAYANQRRAQPVGIGDARRFHRFREGKDVRVRADRGDCLRSSRAFRRARWRWRRTPRSRYCRRWERCADRLAQHCRLPRPRGLRPRARLPRQWCRHRSSRKRRRDRLLIVNIPLNTIYT